MNITEKKYEEIIKRRNDVWVCKNCIKTRNERRSSILNNTIENTHTMMTIPATSSSSTVVISPTTIQTPLQIQPQLNNINLMDIFKKLSDLQTNITELKNELSTYKSTTDKLLEENDILKTENTKLKQRVEYIEQEISKIKQHNINNNILIYGIPKNDNENPKTILFAITSYLGINIKSEDLITIYRKKNHSKNVSGLSQPILVKFNKNEIKKSILVARRNKNLNTEIISQNLRKRPIYINEQLTQHNQLLFKCARELKKTESMKFVWTKNGEIFIRKTADSQIIKIRSLNQINDITQNV